MKPFSNAYDAIKKLFRNLFGKKDEEVQNFVVDEPLKPLRFDDEIKPEATSDDRDKQVQEVLDSLEKDGLAGPQATFQEAKPETAVPTPEAPKTEDVKPATPPQEESMIGNIYVGTPSAEEKAEQDAITEQTYKKPVKSEEELYQEEVRKRAERAAKREAEDRKKEVEEVKSTANSNRVRWVTDPVTGEEVTLGKLPEEATFLKKYTRIQTTSDDVIISVNSIIKHPDMPKNIVILGRNGFGTVKVGEDFARSFYKLGIVKSETIAKAKAKQLNKMSLDALTKLKGGCLIIENAGLVTFDKLVEVIKDSAPDKNDYVVILTGEIDSLSNFFEENEDIVDEFIYLIDIHKIKERGMIHLAKGYVKEKGYEADKAVYDKLKISLKGMEEGNIDRFVAHMDEMMLMCDKRVGEGGIKTIIPEDIL